MLTLSSHANKPLLQSNHPLESSTNPRFSSNNSNGYPNQSYPSQKSSLCSQCINPPNSTSKWENLLQSWTKNSLSTTTLTWKNQRMNQALTSVPSASVESRTQTANKTKLICCCLRSATTSSISPALRNTWKLDLPLLKSHLKAKSLSKMLCADSAAKLSPTTKLNIISPKRKWIRSTRCRWIGELILMTNLCAVTARLSSISSLPNPTTKQKTKATKSSPDKQPSIWPTTEYDATNVKRTSALRVDANHTTLAWLAMRPSTTKTQASAASARRKSNVNTTQTRKRLKSVAAIKSVLLWFPNLAIRS